MTQTPTPVPDDATASVDRYLAALNEPDPAVRRRLVEQSESADGGIIDPPLAGQGHDGISALGDALHAHYTGHAFRRTSAVDCHHDRFRSAWELAGPAGVATTGRDTGVLAPDGRVGQVVGFFGELAPR